MSKPTKLKKTLALPVRSNHDMTRLVAAIAAASDKELWKEAFAIIADLEKRANATRPQSIVNTSFAEMLEKLTKVQDELIRRMSDV